MAYDVADDRRRAEVARALEDCGIRVQFSVFECRLDDRRLDALRRRLEQILDHRVDRVAYYRLCSRCSGRERGSGGP